VHRHPGGAGLVLYGHLALDGPVLQEQIPQVHPGRKDEKPQLGGADNPRRPSSLRTIHLVLKTV